MGHSIALAPARIRPARPGRGARRRRRAIVRRKADEGAKTSERRIGLPSSVVMAVGGNGGLSSRRTDDVQSKGAWLPVTGKTEIWNGDNVSNWDKGFFYKFEASTARHCLLSLSSVRVRDSTRFDERPRRPPPIVVVASSCPHGSYCSGSTGKEGGGGEEG